MDKFILGLDIWTNSIGAAIVICDDNLNPFGLIGLHNRIFSEMVEADTRVPKNKKRREKRGARRLVRRYKERRANLVRLLVENKMLPDNMQDMKDWEREFNKIGEPFSLRAKGLDEPLSPHEFGRVLMHLLRRRGYRSNRGAKYIDLMKHPKVIELHKSELQDNDEEGEDKKKIDERKKVLAGIKQLQQEMGKSKSTLGEFVYKTSLERQHEPRRITKLRFEVEDRNKNKTNDIVLYADRKMYESEFNALWEKQKDFLKLTDGLKAQIYEVIFLQRPMQIQKNLVGKCSFELKRKRAARALLEAQEFRMLQEINDLKVKLPYEPFAPLTKEQKIKLLNALYNHDNLNEKGQLTWANIKKELGLDKKAKFNLEETSKYGISGNRTNLAFSQAIPEHWKYFDEQQKRKLIEDLLTIHKKEALFSRLINEHNRENNPWRFCSEEAYALSTLELEPGYMKHCLKVINNLLPYMRVNENQDGLNYHDACQQAGYLRKDQITVTQQASLPLPPNVANPIVQKALFEARRVVNGILKTYGRPNFDLIRIELARDLKASKKHREEIQKQNRENQRLNENAEREIVKMTGQSHASPEDKLKYKLWNELGGNHCCIYCGNPISQTMLVSADVEIDHIFPLSRSHDDSYLNKVLCHVFCNQVKGQRTPYEAWGKTERFNDILKRLEKLEKDKLFDSRKIAKIKETNFDEKGFVAAQLNDTRYICVAVKNYLEQLGISVQVSTGTATAKVRRFLGLDNILPKKPSAPKPDTEPDDELEGDEGQNKKSGSVKKRDDHRHHAIDAFVTALTDMNLLKEITKRYQYFEKNRKWPHEELKNIWAWNNLRSDVKQVLMESVVSHATNRKISGALHAEMPFGVSYYLEEVEVKKLKQEVVQSEPEMPNAEKWIFEKDARELVRVWWKDGNKDKKIPLPLKKDGSPLEKVKIANRCYVKRIPIKDAFKYIANEPGKKTWIVDKGVRNILAEWLKVTGNKPEKAEENPPKMLNKKNPDSSNLIKTVRVATTFRPSSIQPIGKTQTQFFELGSNHHVVIFKHKETGKREGKVVSMLEAASRVRKPPIIKTEYPEFNPSEWEFEMFLCQNDIIEFDLSDVPQEHLKLGKPLYRLQKMTGSDGALHFRHHAVTATDNKDRYGLIQCKPQTMPKSCKKVLVDYLGRQFHRVK